MKKIKKRVISTVLALSMGMSLMPTDFTGFRAYKCSGHHQAEQRAHQESGQHPCGLEDKGKVKNKGRATIIIVAVLPHFLFYWQT